MMRTAPKLRSWEGNRFTICCEERMDRLNGCDREAWIMAIRAHCTGGAKALSGSSEAKATGIHVESSEPMYYGDSADTKITTTTADQQCVRYECSGTVRP
jgi:hypothetical protein